jgi:hypothetical protein
MWVWSLEDKTTNQYMQILWTESTFDIQFYYIETMNLFFFLQEVSKSFYLILLEGKSSWK